MSREEALNLLKQNLQNQNLIKHCLAAETAMRGLAEFFNQPPAPEQARYGASIENWGICGLLHDIDYETTKDSPQTHSKIGSEMLKQAGLDEEICQAVLTHNEAHGIIPETLMAKAIFCVDPLTGLIVASTLVLPSKKINDLTPENVINRFKEKSFARGANREIIAKCQELLNLPLEKFIEIVLISMQKISSDLGL